MKNRVLCCVGVLLALCAGGCATSADSQEAGNPLACRFASYGKYEEAAWTHLPSLGVNYVFLNVPEPDQVEAAMKRLGDAKLKPLVMRGNMDDLSKDKAVDELAVQLATCEKMGVKYMFLSPKHGNAPKEVAYGKLRAAGDIAKKHGVIIALETHPDLGTNGDVHIETMKAINHPNVRVNFDTGNITYYNKDADALAELKKVIDYVATVEFKDHTGGLEVWEFPPLGRGKVKFPEIVKLLKAHGYAGPITLEFEGTKGVELTEDQTKQAIEQSIAYARSLGTFK